MKISLNEIIIKELNEDNLNELMEIQEETFLHLEDKTELRKNTKETFAVCFKFPSVAYGVYLNGEMIAFGMLHCAGISSENLGLSLDEKIDLSTVANVKITVVRPKYRGNGLQRYLIKLLEKRAKDNGFSVCMATAAPTNKYSMNNFLLSGYKVVKTLKKYGGLERALFYKEI